MQYKTIILGRIRQDREWHDGLKKDGSLAATLDRHARELKQLHEAWMADMATARPGGDHTSIASEALERALREMESRFGSKSPDGDANPPSLDGAMAFLRRVTPTA